VIILHIFMQLIYFKYDRFFFIKNKKFWEELIAYLPSYDTGHIENDASSNYTIVAGVFVTAVTFLPSRCLATVGRFLPSRCLAAMGGFLPSLCTETIRGLLPSNDRDPDSNVIS
jgi:hypothetical protein